MNVLARMATASPSLISAFVSQTRSPCSPAPSQLRRYSGAGRADAVGLRAVAVVRRSKGASFFTRAVASPETGVQKEEKTSGEVLEEESVVLPTNESSERLLRIRHTVCRLYSSLLLHFSWD